MTSEMRVPLSTTLPLSLATALAEYCSAAQLSKSAVVVAALTEYIKICNITYDPPISSLTLNSALTLRSDARKSTGRASYSAEFEKFWEHYPRKTGKGAAYASWQKARPDLSAVLTALAWQTKSADWIKAGGDYVPMPATYLNQRRWEDEPRVATPIYSDKELRGMQAAAQWLAMGEASDDSK